jgi:hypothetical protein
MKCIISAEIELDGEGKLRIFFYNDHPVDKPQDNEV